MGNGKPQGLSTSRQGPEVAGVSLGSSPLTRGAQRFPGVILKVCVLRVESPRWLLTGCWALW